MSIDSIAASMPVPPSPTFADAQIGSTAGNAVHGDKQPSHLSKVLTAIGNVARSLTAHLRSPFTRTSRSTLDTDSPRDMKADANVKLLKVTFHQLDVVAPPLHSSLKPDTVALPTPSPALETLPDQRSWLFDVAPTIKSTWEAPERSAPLPADPTPSRRDSIDSIGSVSSLIYRDSFRLFFFPGSAPDDNDDNCSLHNGTLSGIKVNADYEESDTDSWVSDASSSEEVFVEPKVVSIESGRPRVVYMAKAELTEPTSPSGPAAKRRLDSNSDEHGNRFATIRSRPTPPRPSQSLGSIEESDTEDDSLPSIEEEANHERELQLFTEREILRNAAYNDRVISFYI